MKTIVFLNIKGGVGKSSSVTTIAHMLATIYKKRVLIADLDPQGNASTMFSSVDYVSMLLGKEAEQEVYSMEDLLSDPELDPNECISHTKYEGLDIIPAYLTLAEAEERIKAVTFEPQQFKLRNQLDKIRDKYDYCIIDCSPSLSILNINALVAADEVYIPMTVDGGSLMGAKAVQNIVKNVKKYNQGRPHIAGAFFVRYDDTKNVSRSSAEIFNTIMPEVELFPIYTHVSKSLEENTWMQMPLLELDTENKNITRTTIDYAYITKCLTVIDREPIFKEYQNYVVADKEINEMKRLRTQKRQGKISAAKVKRLNELEKKYKGKKINDFFTVL